MAWQSVLWTTWMVVFTPIYFLTILLARLLWWPVTTLYTVTLYLLSPVFYTFGVLLTPVYCLYGALPRLQPLYIFFGSAAFLGLLAGCAAMLTSSVITAATGMNKTGSSTQDESRVKYQSARERREQQQQQEEDLLYEPETPTGIKRFDEPYSSQESDWQWLEQTPGPGQHGRRQKKGLLAQTILEEEDSL